MLIENRLEVYLQGDFFRYHSCLAMTNTATMNNTVNPENNRSFNYKVI